MLAKADGVVLRAREYGESNIILTLFTLQQGKRSALARGAKKMGSRLSAAVLPFVEGQYIYFAGSGMVTLTQADVLEGHVKVRSDLGLTAYASYFAELLDKLTEEKEPQSSLYRRFVITLSQLEQGIDPDILARMFELALIAYAGYSPVLDHCVRCRKKENLYRFSVRHGGTICNECSDYDHQALPLSLRAGRVLHTLQKLPPARLGKVEVKEETKQELDKILRAFMGEYLPVRFKARTFLDTMRRDGLL
ncbi:DNA repair protein RecO [Mechercharimyces sp. CAU 1602]|uniref:DNA repair protein RecO n=1 Tax=Mechercharimyces sp. CAU 1602 TaxID=2973933 RepID=UPI002162B40C|nr:DNA repair protein RecO [Mechercharimyces sp. CAU 1602]MCS1350478.1 DNA repair protein RecO [Mechercharimyces sp. CAU 1602]